MAKLTFTETKSCCHLAYDGENGETYRFADNTVWEIAAAWATSLTGFKAILVKPKAQTRKVVVLAFAGTDSVRDVIVDAVQAIGGLPAQYIQALRLAQEIRRSSGDLTHLCGHSLGGGLAAFSSVSTKLDASTVNPAPLVGAASLSALVGDNSQIVNYIGGAREFVSSSPGRNPGSTVNLPAAGNFLTRHMLGNVAPNVALPIQV